MWQLLPSPFVPANNVQQIKALDLAQERVYMEMAVCVIG